MFREETPQAGVAAPRGRGGAQHCRPGWVLSPPAPLALGKLREPCLASGFPDLEKHG